MFLQNKYTNWYYQIINNAKNRHPIGYTERHHIIPASLGGSDDTENKVRLTAREHFVVHKLLVKMTTGKEKSKMAYAFCCFFLGSYKNKGRSEITFSARDYEKKRKLLAEAVSEIHKGKKVSPETIQKMTSSRRKNNKPFPEATRQTHRDALKKRWSENREEIMKSLQSESSRKKISEANKGKDRLSASQRKALYEKTVAMEMGEQGTLQLHPQKGKCFSATETFTYFVKTINCPLVRCAIFCIKPEPLPLGRL